MGRRLTIEVAGWADVPRTGHVPEEPVQQEFLTLPDLAHLCRLLTPARIALVECLMASGPLTLPELVQRTGTPAGQLDHDLMLLEQHLLVEPTAQGWQVPYEEIHVHMLIGPEGAGRPVLDLG